MAKRTKPDEVEIETTVDNINPDTGVNDSGTVITETADVADVIDVIVAAPVEVKTAAELRKVAGGYKADYEHVLQQIQDSVKRTHTLERELLEEVKARVKDQAGDTEQLKALKRQTYAEYESADRAATDAEQREAVT